MRSVRDLSPWFPALVSVAGAMSLLGPWARSGRVDRSSVELLATAGALDLLSQGERVVAVVAWFLVVAAAAVALLGAVWGRPSVAAWAATAMGPALVGAWVVVVRSPLGVRWAAPVGAALGVTAMLAGGLVLMRSTVRAEGRR